MITALEGTFGIFRKTTQKWAVHALPLSPVRTSMVPLQEVGMIALFRIFIGAVLAVLLSGLFSVSVFAQSAAPKVALLYADEALGAAEDVRAHLVAAGYDVTIIDAAAGTPTLGELSEYQVVFTWSAIMYPYADGAELGNVLADFVDSGRGVVQASFSLESGTTNALGGRWVADRYGALSQGRFDIRFQMFLQPALMNHPILSGVGAFHGGASAHMRGITQQGCAEIVARWSNNLPLIAAGAGPRAGRVVALNFHPVSGAFNPQYWRTDTDGARLLTNAVGYASASQPHSGAPSVALVAADEAPRVADVQCKLHNLEMFSRVDVFDVQSSTPDAAALSGYDALLTWTGSSYNDPAGLGDALASYVDSNRGVVHSPVSFAPGSRLEGRWVSQEYRPLIEFDPSTPESLTLTPVDAGHPVLSGVTAVSGGESGHHTISVLNSVPGDPAPAVVATWSNGQPLVVIKSKPAGGRVVSLNMFPPSSDALSDSWDRHTDGARLIANTLLFAANHAPVADAGADHSVEANVAGVPVTLTAAASDADGDHLTFTWSGAVASTTGQAITFMVPPPPVSQLSQTHAVMLTVTDGKGGETTDIVNVVVQDTLGPALLGVPSDVTLSATGAEGAAFTFGPVTGADGVDGVRPASCSRASGMFPIGGTVVTCTSSDSRGNTTSSSFSVTVTAAQTTTSGKVFGVGSIREDDMNYEFAFAASEKTGIDRGGLFLSVRSGYMQPASPYPTAQRFFRVDGRGFRDLRYGQVRAHDRRWSLERPHWISLRDLGIGFGRRARPLRRGAHHDQVVDRRHRRAGGRHTQRR